MDATQDSLWNPLGLDETCPNCSALAERRERVVHGYGDVGADVLVVGESPTAGAEATGVPFSGDEPGHGVGALLADLGLSHSPPTADHPDIENAYLTYLTRCRHPDRPPTDGEIATCDPFLNAEVRMINPEVLVMCDPADQTDADTRAVRDTLRTLLAGDYRQPKGRRGNRERNERPGEERGSDP